ncbi:MAG: hypothetical protein IKA76_02180 [Clostridia bacterium]|nr:hypothetical protein [Clostridia bacterium]
MTQKRRLFGQRMALGVVFVLVACYTLYHLTGFFDTEMKTYAVGLTAETQLVGGNGYVFRDETTLTSSYEGVVDYQSRSGVKVGEGQLLASVYQKGDAAKQDRIAVLDSQISLLEQSLRESATVTDPLLLRDEIRDEYLSLMNGLADENAVDLSDGVQDLLTKMNRMDVLINEKEAACYKSLTELRKERKKIFDEAGESKEFYARQSGYFYSYTDGCEDLFTMSAAETLDETSFYELVAELEQAEPTKGAWGKLCADVDWKLVLPVSREEGERFAKGQVYYGTFGNGAAKIPLTLEDAKDAPAHGQTLLVFSADRMPDGFSFERRQSVRMEVTRIEGLYVPKNVVVRQDDGYGVYILRGSVVRLRYVEILYEGSDYYLVRDQVEHEDGKVYLQANDLIILNGKNLFDGRVMD